MALTTTTTLIQAEERQGFALNCPSSVINLSLAANTSKNVLLSSLVDATNKKATYLAFAGNGDFYVLWNGASTSVPAADILDGTSPELTPSVRKITTGITQFSVIAPAAMNLTILLYTGS